MCDILSCNFRPVTNRYKIYVFIIYDNCEFSNVLLKKSLSIHYDTNSHVWTDEITDNNNFTSLHLLNGDSQGRKTVRNQRSVFKKKLYHAHIGSYLTLGKNPTEFRLYLYYLFHFCGIMILLNVFIVLPVLEHWYLFFFLWFLVAPQMYNYDYSFQQQLLRYFLK